MPRIDTATRIIHARPDAIFQAMITPRALEAWLPPTGMTGRIIEFNPRPGGGYRMILRHDDPAIAGKSGGSEDIAEVRFVEIAPPDRIVEAVDFESDDPRFAGTMTMTWTLRLLDDGSTDVRIEATGMPEGISAKDHAEGMAASLSNLADFVER